MQNIAAEHIWHSNMFNNGRGQLSFLPFQIRLFQSKISFFQINYLHDKRLYLLFIAQCPISPAVESKRAEMCYGWNAPILIIFLQKGQLSSDDPPAEEEPTTVTFVGPDNEWKVYLYENGFLFEDQYYLLDKAAMIFFTTMHAG
ncbi:MAG TPA: hypothetical protein VIL89_08600 [Clostridia bacterium]